MSHHPAFKPKQQYNDFPPCRRQNMYLCEKPGQKEYSDEWLPAPMWISLTPETERTLREARRNIVAVVRENAERKSKLLLEKGQKLLDEKRKGLRKAA